MTQPPNRLLNFKIYAIDFIVISEIDYSNIYSIILYLGKNTIMELGHHFDVGGSTKYGERLRSGSTRGTRA